MGEDIGVYGGVFKVTEGLLTKFGPERVRETPISEAGFVGMGVGLAMTGKRPVCELMFMDFRVRRQRSDLQPGRQDALHVGRPGQDAAADPHAAGRRPRQRRTALAVSGDLLHPHPRPQSRATRHALRRQKACSRRRCARITRSFSSSTSCSTAPKARCRRGNIWIPFGRAEVKRAGNDVTLVSYSRTLLHSLEAAEQAAGDGISVEVIDLRCTVSCPDLEAILASVRKTGRLIVADEAHRSVGVGADIELSLVQEYAFDYLDAPIGARGGYGHPHPLQQATGGRGSARTGADPQLSSRWWRETCVRRQT